MTEYSFDAHVTIEASGTKEDAADEILEYCMDNDIAISLHTEGSLNTRSTPSGTAYMVSKPETHPKPGQQIVFKIMYDNGKWSSLRSRVYKRHHTTLYPAWRGNGCIWWPADQYTVEKQS